MRKRFVIIILVCSIISAITLTFALSSSDYKFRVGDELVTMQYPVFMQNDRIYVSIRNICDILGIPIDYNQSKDEVQMDIYNKKIPVSGKTKYVNEGVLPDKETAYEVGKKILEKYIGKELEYETDTRKYFLDTRYIEEENAWLIVQLFRFKNENAGGGIDGWADFINIKLNKNTGEVMFINTYGTYSNSPE